MKTFYQNSNESLTYLLALKTSPAIYEQRKNLERAKMGDLLKAKMQQRPNRQELERRHILDSHEAHIDPSLADKKRQLEKAILHDQLNKKIQHRPGPFELIEKNILHADEPIERIVKEGLVPFKISSEENLAEKNFLSFEDDSQSSEGDLFSQSSQIQTDILKDANATLEIKPQEVTLNNHNKNIFDSLPTTSGIINISLVPTNTLISSQSAPISVATFKIHPHVETINIPPPPPPPKLELITYHVKPMIQAQVKGLVNTQSFLPIQITETPMNGINTTIITPSLVPSQTQTAVNQHVSSFIQNNQKFSAPGKDKNRKKSKSKSASKARAIKFHEYKGPPNKSSSTASPASLAASKKAGETNYELIMQQQCLLEYLEGIYKNPNEIPLKPDVESQKYPAKNIKIEKPSDFASDEREKPMIIADKPKAFNKPQVTIFPSKPATQVPPLLILQETSKDAMITDVSKLSKMKVSELKAYLKRVNQPVSGPKPHLIERLKHFLPLKPLEDSNKDETSSMISDGGNDYYSASLNSVSSAESDMDNLDTQQSSVSSVHSISKDEDIVAEQQRKIEELQRKLQQSQQELEQMKQTKVEVPGQQIEPQTIVFDQYQIQSPISSVFLVDAAQPSPASEVVASPVRTHTPLTNSPLSHIHNMTLEDPLLDNLLNEENDPTLAISQQIDKEVNASSSNVIPMSQDITDVLEILLKNGEWPDLEDDGKGGFIQSTSDHSSLSNPNILSAKDFIDDVLSSHNTYDEISPMNEDAILHADESIEKILGKVSLYSCKNQC